MFTMQRILLLSFLLNFSTLTFLKAQNWELGIMAGAASYRGDISVNLKTFLPQLGFSGGLYGRKFIGDNFSTRLAFTYSQLSGNEAKYPTTDLWARRGFAYSGHIMGVNGAIEWRPLGKTALQPYLLGNIGGVSFDGQTTYNEPNTVISAEDITKDKNAIYSKKTVFLGTGGGLQYFINEDISIGLELTLHISLSDHLDGIALITGSKSKDFVTMGSFTIAKVFSGNGRGMSSRNVRCPSFN